MTEHTVKSYDDELAHLTGIIARMGGMAEAQLASAMQALESRDGQLAARVIAGDARVDELEQEVHQFTIRMLALRQPVAGDLRHIVGALKISSELERVGDYAANVAKRVLVLNQLSPVKAVAGLQTLAGMVREILKDVLDATMDRDVDKALLVWARDEEVDDLYAALFTELIDTMVNDPRAITACTHLMFMAKNIERIGDHATNIAETLHFMVVGRPLKGDRPKGHALDEGGPA